MVCESSVCSRLPKLAFGHRVGEHDDVLASSIVPRCSAFCQVFPSGGTDPPCPTSYGFVLFVSGDERFEPIGQLDEPELARVFRAVKGIAHPHLSQLGGCVDIAEQAVEQVEEALQIVVGIACRIAAKGFEQRLVLSGSQLPVLFHSVVLATWAIRSKRACLTTTTTPFKHRFCERRS